MIQFPCPRCSTATPLDVTAADHATEFACGAPRCGYTRALGPKFPSVHELLRRFAHLSPDTARAKIVDALTAWYLDWSDLRD